MQGKSWYLAISLSLAEFLDEKDGTTILEKVAFLLPLSIFKNLHEELRCFKILRPLGTPGSKDVGGIENGGKGVSNSYTMGCPPVRGDNPRALASGLSYVQVDKHGITILYHLHQCRPCTSSDIPC